jgi:hypothetical protein
VTSLTLIRLVRRRRTGRTPTHGREATGPAGRSQAGAASPGRTRTDLSPSAGAPAGRSTVGGYGVVGARVRPAPRSRRGGLVAGRVDARSASAGRRIATVAARAVVSGTAAISPSDPTTVLTISSARSSELRISAARTPAGREQHQQRERRPGVGEEQRVDHGGDVVASDLHRPPEQGGPGQRAVGVVQREHRRGLADRDVVEHPERGDDEPGEHQALQVEPLDREPGEDGVVGREPGDLARSMNSSRARPSGTSAPAVPTTAEVVISLIPWVR